MRTADLVGVGFLVVVAACSPVRIDSNLMDADDVSIDGTAVSDAAVDATAVGPVTVVVYDVFDGTPVSGAKVVFSNPDGSMIDIVLTDSDGAAALDVPVGASVTAGYSRPREDTGMQHMVQTVFAVHPGDTIELGPILPEPTYQEIGAISVKVPSAVAGAGQYTIGTVCNETQTFTATDPGIYYHKNDRCTRGRVPIDLLGIAWDAAGGPFPLAYSRFLDLDPGDTSTHTGAAWQADFARLDLTASNSPFPGSLDIRARLLHEGIDYQFGRNHDEVPVATGGSAGYLSFYPPGFTETLQVKVQLRNNAGNDMRMYFRNLAPTATSFEFDLADRMLPRVDGVVVADADLARPALLWTYDDGFAATVGGLGYVMWIDTDDAWVWQFLVPPDAAPPFQLPFMPGDLVEVWPIPSTATPAMYLGAYLLGGGFVDWNDFRQHRGLGIIGEDDVILPADAPPGAEALITAGGLID